MHVKFTSRAQEVTVLYYNIAQGIFQAHPCKKSVSYQSDFT